MICIMMTLWHMLCLKRSVVLSFCFVFSLVLVAAISMTRWWGWWSYDGADNWNGVDAVKMTMTIIMTMTMQITMAMSKKWRWQNMPACTRTRVVDIEGCSGRTLVFAMEVVLPKLWVESILKLNSWNILWNREYADDLRTLTLNRKAKLLSLTLN